MTQDISRYMRRVHQNSHCASSICESNACKTCHASCKTLRYSGRLHVVLLGSFPHFYDGFGASATSALKTALHSGEVCTTTHAVHASCKTCDGTDDDCLMVTLDLSAHVTMPSPGLLLRVHSNSHCSSGRCAKLACVAPVSFVQDLRWYERMTA